mgnify:CR=1 FL=1
MIDYNSFNYVCNAVNLSKVVNCLDKTLYDSCFDHKKLNKNDIFEICDRI